MQEGGVFSRAESRPLVEILKERESEGARERASERVREREGEICRLRERAEMTCSSLQGCLLWRKS